MNKAINIFLSLVLSLFSLWGILAIGAAAKIPVTPCFYIGNSQNIKPAKPCIDSIGWDTYQVIGLFLFIGLTWGWYMLLKKHLEKTMSSKKGKKAKK